MAEVSELKGKVGIEGIPETTTGLKTVGKGMRELGDDAKGAAGKLAETQSAWGRFKSDFTSGFNFSAGLSAFNLLKDGLSSVGSMAMTAATEYESAMNILEASSGANEETMRAFSATAKALGSDLGLPATSAGGAASAMLELSKAGLTAEESMAAARGTIQLAATEMMSESRAAQITAGALNAFSLSGTDATRVADLLAAGSNASAASVGGLATGLQQMSAAFAANNQTIDTSVTALAALANVGYSASDSGTALSNMMMRLSAPTAEAKNLMGQLGFNAFDAQGKMKPLETIVEELGAATANMTDEQRNAALSTIFLSDGMKAMNPLLNLGADGFTNLRGKVQEQGAAAKLAEAQTKGFKGAMEGLKSAVETLAVEGLTPLLPILSVAIRAFSAMLTPVGAIAGFLSNNFVPVVGGAATALAVYGAASVTAAGGTAGLGLALQVMTGQALGAAAAFAAVAIPLALIAVSVAGPIIALNHLTDVATEQSKAMLKNRDAYNEAKEALGNYANAASTLQGNPALESEAQKLKELTALYEEKFKRATGDGTANWFKAAFDSGDVTSQQIAELKELEDQLVAVRAEVEKQTTIATFDSKAMDGAVADFNAMEAAADGYVVTAQEAFVVTEEAAKKAEQELERLATAGPGAYDALIASASNFQTARETAQATHLAKMAELRRTGTPDQIAAEEAAYRAQEQTAASSYVAQQAAQRVHLAQMTIEWIKAQAMTNADFAAKSSELIQMVASDAGIIASAGDMAWGGNLNAIRGYVDGAIPTLDALSATMAANTEQAIDNHSAAEKLNAKYTTEFDQKWAAGAYGSGPEAAEAYRRDLDSVPTLVQTEIKADAATAVAQAEKAQDQYDRMERRIESEIVADPAAALLAANDVRDEYDRVPDTVTTVLHADGTAVKGEATAAGQDAGAGFAAGIAASAAQAATAARNMAAGAISAARAALDSRSPSRVFAAIGRDTNSGYALGIQESASMPRTAVQSTIDSMVAQHRTSQSTVSGIGRQYTQSLATGIQSNSAALRTAASSSTQTYSETLTSGIKAQIAVANMAAQLVGREISTATGAGIEAAQTIPRDKLKKAVGDVADAYRTFTNSQADLNRSHAAELKGIWDEYYADLKAQTESFNGDKFDQQMGFYEDIADMDAASRQRALDEQKTAWDTAQQMAQDGRAAEAAAYYEAALAETQADEERAARIVGIAEDIAAKKAELADASTEEQAAALAAEIAELESRQAYLEQLDAQQDELAASRLEEMKNADSATAAQRDEALAEENTDYKEAQEKLAADFGTAVDAVLGHEDRMLAGHVEFANALIGSYEGAAEAARRAMASLPSGGGGGEGEAPEGEPATEGSYASGLEMVPSTRKGYSVVTVHPGEGILTPNENQMWLSIKRGMAGAAPAQASAAPSAQVGEQPIIIQGPLIGEAHFHNDLDVEVVTNQILKRLRQGRP